MVQKLCFMLVAGIILAGFFAFNFVKVTAHRNATATQAVLEANPVDTTPSVDDAADVESKVDEPAPSSNDATDEGSAE